jgi:hypothetical protein
MILCLSVCEGKGSAFSRDSVSCVPFLTKKAAVAGTNPEQRPQHFGLERPMKQILLRYSPGVVMVVIAWVAPSTVMFDEPYWIAGVT